MALTLSRIDRIYRRYPTTAVLAAGGPATITGVDVALLPVKGAPTAATVWAASTYAAGVATILLAGPDADSTGALVVPADADLWMRITDAPEVEAVFVERISVKGSAGTVNSLIATTVNSINGLSGVVTIPIRAPWNVRTVTTATNAAASDYILADTTAATFTVTAPAPVANGTWGVKWVLGTVAPTLAGTFNSAVAISALDQAVEFISDGTKWYRQVRPALAQLPDYPATTDTRYASPTAAQTITGQWVFRTPVISRGNDASGQVIARVVGDTSDGVFNWQHNGDLGYLFHMTTGPLMTANALIGMGIDNGGLGIMLRNKNTGIGMKIEQFAAVTGTGHYGLWVQQSNTAIPATRFEQIVAGAYPVMEWFSDANATTGQKLTRWVNSAGEIGYVDGQSGNLVWKGAIAVQRAAGFNTVLISRNGDAQQRLAIDVDGKCNWSSGAAAADTVLERKAAKVLGTGVDNALRVGAVATASRVAAATAGAGAFMYDTTLSKPIYSDGTNWRDAAGTIV